jgi:hypothetical protein
LPSDFNRASQRARPAFKASIVRAFPSGVVGPVEKPPCSRQRFDPRTAQFLHRVRRKYFAISPARIARSRAAWRNGRWASQRRREDFRIRIPSRRSDRIRGVLINSTPPLLSKSGPESAAGFLHQTGAASAAPLPARRPIPADGWLGFDAAAKRLRLARPAQGWAAIRCKSGKSKPKSPIFDWEDFSSLDRTWPRPVRAAPH